jgi:monofunctional biosynthetic peptidoglycan transglycosylase
MRYVGERYRVHHARDAWTPLAAVAPALIAAVVKGEDPGFFGHRGVDWARTREATATAWRVGRVVTGASTITQQLARNLYLTPTRSLRRKAREMLIALRLERVVSKARILELYLNLVEWGSGVWGCRAASEHYFKKAPGDLDLFDSTLLVVLLPAPRAALTGRLADHARRRQLALLYQLFLSGIARGEACAIACARTLALHRLLANGVPLRLALPMAATVMTSEDAELFCDLERALDLTPLASAQVFQARCGLPQQIAAFERLCALFGRDEVMRVLATGSLDSIKQHPRVRRLRHGATA